MDIKQKVEFILMQLSEVLEELNQDQPFIANFGTFPAGGVVGTIGDHQPQSAIQSSERQIAQQMQQNSQVIEGEAKISQGKWRGENVEIHDFGSKTI